MISPNFVPLEEWARENDLRFASRAELIANPKVQALYEGIVEGINGNLARFEKLKRVLLVADEFTADNGVLTPTMKLKQARDRRALQEADRRAVRTGRSNGCAVALQPMHLQELLQRKLASSNTTLTKFDAISSNAGDRSLSLPAKRCLKDVRSTAPLTPSRV